MPGTLIKIDELHDFAFSPNQQVSRHLEGINGLKIRMVVGIETVGEKLFDVIPRPFFRRQTDAMNHQQRNVFGVGASIEIRRRTLASASEAMIEDWHEL